MVTFSILDEKRGSIVSFCDYRVKEWDSGLEKARSVFHYWFGEEEKDVVIGDRMKMWFGPSNDEEIKTKFGRLVRSAINGGLVQWERHPKAALAKV